MKRIKSFLRNSMGHSRLTALAMLSIEKELVHSMTDFIEVFSKKKHMRIEVLYK